MTRKAIDDMTEAEVRAYARALERQLAALEQPDYVYFAHDPAHAVIKIGHSRHVAQRLAALCRATQRELVLLGVQRGNKYLKKRLQKQFAHLAAAADGAPLADPTVKTEWFRAGADLLDYIRNQTHALPEG